MKTKLPGDTLTVIIRDDGPLVHCGDSPSYRSVRITLTEEQRSQIALRNTHGTGREKFYEQISKCFIEEAADKEAK